jgi:cytoskeletal protein RodZ
MSQNTEALNITTDEESVFIKAGMLFKNARESKNITIQQASQELHIRQLYIAAIEAGDIAALPGHVYKVGFIKTYARFLNLDSVQILKDLNLQEEITPSYSSFNYSIPVEQQKRPTLKIILAATTLLFIGGVTLYVSNNMSHVHEEAINSKEFSDQSITTTQSVSSSPSQNLAPSADINTTAEETTTTISTIPSSTPPETPRAALTPQEDATVKILAVKDAWVQVTDETGKAIFVRLMRTGESYTVPANSKYHLNTGNGAGIKLSIGDKASVILGEEGKVLRGISLNSEDVRKLIKD